MFAWFIFLMAIIVVILIGVIFVGFSPNSPTTKIRSE